VDLISLTQANKICTRCGIGTAKLFFQALHAFYESVLDFGKLGVS
jgi:ribosomal protein S27AE